MHPRTALPVLSRWSRRLLATIAGSVLLIGLAPGAEPVLADSPVVQTWWTVNTVAVDLPVPSDVLAPGAAPPVTIPSTDVPDGGSEVAGTTDNPTGALTLRYEFLEGSSLGPLVLTLAQDTAPAPGTELIACPLTGDGDFESQPGGAPISQMPESDCGSAVSGVLDDSAGTYRFPDIASVSSADHLSVAILPVAGRAVFEHVLSDSLAVTEPERSGLGLQPRFRPTAPAAPTQPKPFLGQVRQPTPKNLDVAPVPTTVTTPPPNVSGPRQVVDRYVTVVRGTVAGQPAGSAIAGTILLMLAASSIWRRGQVELMNS